MPRSNRPLLIPFDSSDTAAAEAVATQLERLGMTCHHVIPLPGETYVQVSAGIVPADVQTIRSVIRDVLGW